MSVSNAWQLPTYRKMPTPWTNTDLVFNFNHFKWFGKLFSSQFYVIFFSYLQNGTINQIYWVWKSCFFNPENEPICVNYFSKLIENNSLIIFYYYFHINCQKKKFKISNSFSNDIFNVILFFFFSVILVGIRIQIDRA